MKEEEAKTKRCCGSSGCGTLINPVSGGKIPQEMLLDLAKEPNSPRWCIASECVAWVIGASDDVIAQAKGMGGGIPAGGRCGLIK